MDLWSIILDARRSLLSTFEGLDADQWAVPSLCGGWTVRDLLVQYRDVAGHRFSPPGWPDAAPLSDVLVHSLDVRIPLGLESDEPPAHYEPVLELLFGRMGGSFTTAARPDVRWVATDHPWSHGTGAEVHGAMEDLALTAAGRSVRIDELQGDGVAAVRTWLG